MEQLTPEEVSYLDKTVTHLEETLPVDKIAALITIGKLSIIDDRLFIAFVYTLLAEGYILRDDEEMGKPHKFSLDDILEDK